MPINPDEFTKEPSPLFIKVIGSIFLLLTLFLAVIAWFTGDGSITVLSFVVGIPVGLVCLSLLFGQAKRGQGILSPFSLYFVGVSLVVASVGGIYSGVPKSGIGFLFGFACFVLAKKRRCQRKSL